MFFVLRRVKFLKIGKFDEASAAPIDSDTKVIATPRLRSYVATRRENTEKFEIEISTKNVERSDFSPK